MEFINIGDCVKNIFSHKMPQLIVSFDATVKNRKCSQNTTILAQKRRPKSDSITFDAGVSFIIYVNSWVDIHMKPYIVTYCI